MYVAPIDDNAGVDYTGFSRVLCQGCWQFVPQFMARSYISVTVVGKDLRKDAEAWRGFPSKAQPQRQLKRAWATRSEDLVSLVRWLAERGARQISAIAGEVGFVIQVKDLADQRRTPALSKHERPAQAQIQRMRIVAKRKVAGSASRGMGRPWESFVPA